MCVHRRWAVPRTQRGGAVTVLVVDVLAEPELPQIPQASEAAERGLQGGVLLPQEGRRHRIRVSAVQSKR